MTSGAGAGVGAGRGGREAKQRAIPSRAPTGR